MTPAPKNKKIDDTNKNHNFNFKDNSIKWFYEIATEVEQLGFPKASIHALAKTFLPIKPTKIFLLINLELECLSRNGLIKRLCHLPVSCWGNFLAWCQFDCCFTTAIFLVRYFSFPSLVLLGHIAKLYNCLVSPYDLY